MREAGKVLRQAYPEYAEDINLHPQRPSLTSDALKRRTRLFPRDMARIQIEEFVKEHSGTIDLCVAQSPPAAHEFIRGLMCRVRSMG